MKSKQNHRRIGIAGLATLALFFASFSVLSTATAGDDEIVDGISKIESLKPGEVTAGSCDSVATDLEKRGKLEYDEETGALKFVDAARGD